ncbi:hypothetical protein GCK32_001971 [Trichostrongylus colubriformis]|uniref:Uncharacterized protein n=1 Tax=Trichostrongylus colubriformis TaxID=6319 RepID=A0AAN8J223_TRICO
MITTTSTFRLTLIIAIATFVEPAGDASHLHKKLAEVKRKQGLDNVSDTHKAIYPIRHHSIKHVDVLPMISDYHSVNRERSKVIADHPIHGPLYVNPLSKVSLSELINIDGGVAHLRSGRR